MGISDGYSRKSKHLLMPWGAQMANSNLRTTFVALLAVWTPVRAAEIVSFPSLDAPVTGGKPTTLRGLLMKPDGIGPFPAIIALHGCKGLLKDDALVTREAAWAELLTSHGYVVLFPDSFWPARRDDRLRRAGSCRAWSGSGLHGAYSFHFSFCSFSLSSSANVSE